MDRPTVKSYEEGVLAEHDFQSRNFTIGRGRITINGRYIGPTSKAVFRYNPDTMERHLFFAAQDISSENLDLYFNPGRHEVVYESRNPTGLEQRYAFAADIYPGEFDLKSDDWQELQFLAYVAKPFVRSLDRIETRKES